MAVHTSDCTYNALSKYVIHSITTPPHLFNLWLTPFKDWFVETKLLPRKLVFNFFLFWLRFFQCHCLNFRKHHKKTHLKGVFAKNERGFRLNAIKKLFRSLLILLLSVASMRRKLLKTTNTEERYSINTNSERCNIRLRP